MVVEGGGGKLHVYVTWSFSFYTNQQALSTNVSAAYSCLLQCMYNHGTVCTQSFLAGVNLELSMNGLPSQLEPLRGICVCVDVVGVGLGVSVQERLLILPHMRTLYCVHTF